MFSLFLLQTNGSKIRDMSNPEDMDDLVTVEWDEKLEVTSEITEPELMISIEPQDEPQERNHRYDSVEVYPDFIKNESTPSLDKATNLMSTTSKSNLPFDRSHELMTNGYINIVPISNQQKEHKYSQSTRLKNISSDLTNIDFKRPFYQDMDTNKLKDPKLEQSCPVYGDRRQVDFNVLLSMAHKEEVPVSDDTLQCVRCSWKFSNKDINDHVNNKKCGGEREYICCLCKTNYVALFALRRHVRESHLCENPFECDLCGQRFNNKGSFKRHMAVHSDERPYACSVCGLSFKLENNLKRHWMVHTDERPFPCTICDKKFRKAEHLKKHFLIHTGEKPFKCDKCDGAFRSKYHLEKHQLTHVPGERRFKCKECGARFTLRTCLMQHMKVHTCTEKTYRCKICNKAFARQTFLDGHLKTHQRREVFKKTGEKPFSCDQCNVSYFTKLSLENHVAQDHSERTKTFKCADCNARFASKRKLLLHVKSHKTTEQYELPKHSRRDTLPHANQNKQNSCNVCGEQFRSVRALQWHERSHSGYSCDVCNECFSDLRGLKEHHLICVEKVECSICHMIFESKRGLRRHQKSKHTKPCYVVLESLYQMLLP